jgi:hypothetical protein
MYVHSHFLSSSMPILSESFTSDGKLDIPDSDDHPH